MLRPLRLCLLATFSSLAPACAPAPASAPTSPVVVDAVASETLTPETARLGLRRSVIADEYFWLRLKVLDGDAPKGFEEAVAAMQDMRAALAPDPTAWEDLEVPLGHVLRASELVAEYGELEPKKDIGGLVVPFRAPALRVAQAIQATEGSYRAGPYREHAGDIIRAAKELQARLLVREADLLAAIEKDLGISAGLDRPVVVTLVSDAPYPGIFAADARGKRMASFVRVRGLEGGALCETMLHETIHAVDEFTVRSTSAMNTLRAVLKKRGVAESDVEMAVNTVTFAEAASLVRRFVDPEHHAVGELVFYKLYPPAPAIVVAWERYLSGESIENAAEAVAQAIAGP